MDKQEHDQLAAGASKTQTARAERQTRERSQIEFPYTDLGQAEDLARTLYERGGGTAEPNQLAGWMDQSATGGTFRSRLSAARLFGLVETERGSVSITALGRAAIDENKRDAARVAAFLQVPLFAAMYEKHHGYNLPPATAIERQMVELGVPEKQKERARQVFQKSASVSGFVDPGTGRFIKPAVKERESAAEKPGEEADRGNGRKRGGSSSDTDVNLHPFIEGLLKTLPETGSEWSHKDRVKWLRLAANAFDLIYEGEGSINIDVAPSTKTAAHTE